MNTEGVSFRRKWNPSAPVKYRVEVLHSRNGLRGMVEVISTSHRNAEDLARRTFFRGGGWVVVKTERI